MFSILWRYKQDRRRSGVFKAGHIRRTFVTASSKIASSKGHINGAKRNNVVEGSWLITNHLIELRTSLRCTGTFGTGTGSVVVVPQFSFRPPITFLLLVVQKEPTVN